MALKIITAAERIAAQSKINIALLGPSGVGKTTQARTLPPEKTLFVDLEAGTLALDGSKENPPWEGDIIKARDIAQEMGCHPWEITRGITCLVGGPDPLDEDGPYSLAAYEYYKQQIADPAIFNKYDIIFFDSITVASRWAFSWSKRQPEAFNQQGKADTRGAYGKLGQEMVTWLTNTQHCKKDVIMAGILDMKKDDLNRVTWEPQIEGSKTGLELPGIFDEVITLASLKTEAGADYRAFITQLQNPWGFPAKDRSGCLEVMEPPDLYALMCKIRTGKRLDTEIVTTIPKQTEEKAEAPASVAGKKSKK